MKVKVFLSILAMVLGLCAQGVCLIECDDDGVPYHCEVKGLEWIYRATGTNFPSKVLPQGCLCVTGKFCCFELEFDASAVTNAISAQTQAWIDRKVKAGANVQIGGTHVCRVEMTKNGRHLATALLCEERSMSHAREVAIRDFFSESSMMPEDIARRIDMRFGDVGDYSFSWKLQGAKVDYLTFVRGGAAVIVRGAKDAMYAAKAIDALLLESARLSADGTVVNIADAAKRIVQSDSGGASSLECKEWWAKDMERFTQSDQQSADACNTPCESGGTDASRKPTQNPRKVATTNVIEREEKR